MDTIKIDHTGLTHLFTHVCEDKTEWDDEPLLYVVERPRTGDAEGDYFLTPLSIISDGMHAVARLTGADYPAILETYASAMGMINETQPNLNPAGENHDFLGLAYFCEAYKVELDPDTAKPIDQPAHSGDLADNPNSVEIFCITAVTVDGYIHSHAIERDSRNTEHYHEPMTDEHDRARIPGTLRKMVTSLVATSSHTN